MGITRKEFIKLSSITAAGLPLSKLTGNREWYSFLATDAAADDGLYNTFKNPANTAKPFVRWWWNGLRVVKPEIIRELDMLKTLGIGGVEINSIRFPDTADALQYKELEWLSAEWVDLVQFAAKAAKERGIICDIIMGSGWPFGGEFLNKEEQTQLMALGTRDITGPQTLNVTKVELTKAVDPPVSFKNPDSIKELQFLRLVPASLNSLDQVINLDAEVAKDTIAINIPEGKYVLYSLVKITGYMSVIYGAPGAAGPVLNHFDKEAVQKYINRMSGALVPKMGLLGNSFRSVFTDSLELQGANWCADMLTQFKKRRGYDLIPFFPFILFKTGAQGRPVNAVYGAEMGSELKETLERVRYDFEITKMELFRDHFLTVFFDWCKKNGVKSRVQAYGREFFPLDSSLDVDIPECETWLRTYVGEQLKDFDFKSGRAYSPINKFVSSAAHLSGKRITSCEEITNTEVVFNDTLERIKQTGDQSNLTGVTHSILHGFNYSPKEIAFPGWIRYGSYFNERNTWWPYLHQWVAYKARLSAVFQNGDMVADVAVMHPLADLWSKYSAPWDPFPERAYPSYVHNIWEAIHQNGSGCDYVTELILQHSTANNAKLSYGTRQYSTLLVVNAESIQPATAKSLKRLAEAGVKIIFIERYPDKGTGYHNYEQDDIAVQNAISSIKNKSNVALYPAPQPTGKIIDWYAGLQSKHSIKPNVQMDTPQVMVSQVHYRSAGTEAFFFNNFSNAEQFSFNAKFNVSAAAKAWIWNPETGERYLYPTTGDNSSLAITLGPAETKLIIFDSHLKGQLFTQLLRPAKAAVSIDSPWSLTLNHYDGSTKTIELAKLVDFKEDSNLVGFAGTAIYRNVFNMGDLNNIKVLDLGKVHGISEVILNGMPLGNRWYGDHLYDVKKAIKKGRNEVSIKLTTTLGNYMATSLKQNKDTIKWIVNKKQPLYSQGMLGPVVLG